MQNTTEVKVLKIDKTSPLTKVAIDRKRPDVNIGKL